MVEIEFKRNVLFLEFHNTEIKVIEALKFCVNYNS